MGLPTVALLLSLACLLICTQGMPQAPDNTGLSSPGEQGGLDRQQPSGGAVDQENRRRGGRKGGRGGKNKGAGRCRTPECRKERKEQRKLRRKQRKERRQQRKGGRGGAGGGGAGGKGGRRRKDRKQKQQQDREQPIGSDSAPQNN